MRDDGLYLGWIRPPLNQNLFSVYRPGGSKRADWNFSYHIFLFFFLLFPMYILVYGKMKLEKKNPDLPTGRFFAHPAHRKQYFTFKGGLIL